MDSVPAQGASPSEDVDKDKEDNKKVVGCICVVKTRLCCDPIRNSCDQVNLDGSPVRAERASSRNALEPYADVESLFSGSAQLFSSRTELQSSLDRGQQGDDRGFSSRPRSRTSLDTEQYAIVVDECWPSWYHESRLGLRGPNDRLQRWDGACPGTPNAKRQVGSHESHLNRVLIVIAISKA
jgi:hypothetical protein